MNASALSTGKIEYSIFDPSRGAIGIKLKIARTKLIKTTVNDISINELGSPRTPENLIKSEKNIAKIKLDTGPAAATINSPHL